jgi:hypothetical protein
MIWRGDVNVTELRNVRVANGLNSESKSGSIGSTCVLATDEYAALHRLRHQPPPHEFGGGGVNGTPADQRATGKSAWTEGRSSRNYSSPVNTPTCAAPPSTTTLFEIGEIENVP